MAARSHGPDRDGRGNRENGPRVEAIEALGQAGDGAQQQRRHKLVQADQAQVGLLFAAFPAHARGQAVGVLRHGAGQIDRHRRGAAELAYTAEVLCVGPGGGQIGRAHV
mgnify:CR=1 FL=1